MVGYLREMATFSEQIAGGNLTVDVKPRSERDTLGRGFLALVEGLHDLVRAVRDAASQVCQRIVPSGTASDESAKISLQPPAPLTKVTSTMHEMSVNVQNMVKSTQTQGGERKRDLIFDRRDGRLDSARGGHGQGPAGHFQPFAGGSTQRHHHHGQSNDWPQPHQTCPSAIPDTLSACSPARAGFQWLRLVPASSSARPDHR